MKKPAVSILLPVRDEIDCLPAALNSLKRQTLDDWQLVVVDDGSRDGSGDWLSAEAARDPRITLVRRPPEGLVAALKVGLTRCRATLVARMDADDISHPARLERQVDFLHHHPDIALVASRVRHFPRRRITAGMAAYEAWQNRHLDPDSIARDIWVESPFAHPSVCFRKAAVEAVGGYRQMPWAEDYDLWLRLHRAGARFARLPQTLLFWRDRDRRLTRTSSTCSLDAFRACRLYHLRHGPLQGTSEVCLWGAGIEGKAWRRQLETAGIRVAQWIDVDPRKIGQTIHNAPVVAPSAGAVRRFPTLVTIGSRDGREQVRAWASNQGLAEPADYLCVT